MFLRIARPDPETSHHSRRKGTPHEIASATTDFKKGGEKPVATKATAI